MQHATSRSHSVSVMGLSCILHQIHNKHIFLPFNPMPTVNCCGLSRGNRKIKCKQKWTMTDIQPVPRHMTLPVNIKKCKQVLHCGASSSMRRNEKYFNSNGRDERFVLLLFDDVAKLVIFKKVRLAFDLLHAKQPACFAKSYPSSESGCRSACRRGEGVECTAAYEAPVAFRGDRQHHRIHRPKWPQIHNSKWVSDSRHNPFVGLN